MDRKYNDFIGDALANSDQTDLPGKGKPLSKDYLQGDTFQHFQKIAKDAGFLPQWLKLQKDIAQQLENVKTEVDIREINEKIQKYNRLCPVSMQRHPVTLKNLAQAKKRWL